MNILTDMPIETTNLAYIRFIEVQKESIDKLNHLENRLIDLENKIRESEYKADLERLKNKAEASKDKTATQTIALSYGLFSIFASLLTGVVVVIINDPELYSKYIEFTDRLYPNIILIACALGGMIGSSIIMKRMIDVYFKYVATKAEINEDGTSYVLLEYKT